MSLVSHVIGSALRSRSTVICCLVTWGVAFAVPPALPESIGTSSTTSSQVISATYFLTVVITSITLHTAVGRRGRSLRLFRFTPVSGLRLLGECMVGVVVLGGMIGLGGILTSQLAPWHRI